MRIEADLISVLLLCVKGRRRHRGSGGVVLVEFAGWGSFHENKDQIPCTGDYEDEIQNAIYCQLPGTFLAILRVFCRGIAPCFRLVECKHAADSRALPEPKVRRAGAASDVIAGIGRIGRLRPAYSIGLGKPKTVGESVEREFKQLNMRRTARDEGMRLVPALSCRPTSGFPAAP
jgi:hypothetical protein